MTDWEEHWKSHAVAATPPPDSWSGAVIDHAFAAWERVFDECARGRRMLECGSGAARLSLHMARRGFDCTLLDRSPRALAIGLGGFRDAGLHARGVVGDVTSIALAADQFDVVYTGGMLEFIPQVERAIAEMVRVLKPGGLFAAHVVPDKVSCQTLGDWQRTIFQALRAALSLDASRIFTRVRFFPADAVPSTAPLAAYSHAVATAGVRVVRATGTTPFPYLSLPSPLHRAYARAMRRMERAWARFDESDARWTERWGLSYTLYGIKEGGTR